jgi:ATP-dependent protease Clp ATPase subunit
MECGRIVCRCSFCSKRQSDVYRLFAGPEGVYICDECVTLSSEAVAEALEAEVRQLPSPRAKPRFWRR